jgi:rod shape-determining protein MreB
MHGDVAIDLGTSNTVILVRGAGVVLDEPSMVTVDVRNGRMVAVGREAHAMLGRTPPRLRTARPLANGVVADLSLCERMLRAFVKRAAQHRWTKPRVVICVPSGVTGIEQRAVREVAEAAGARKPVFVIEEAMAAAIGAGLPVERPVGNAVVDIGGGTTEVAVISLGGVVTSASVAVAGDAFDEAIVAFARKEYGIAIGLRTAERIKARYGSAWELREEGYVKLGGSRLGTGLPHTVTVSTEELRAAIEVPLVEIIDAVSSTLDRTPPELVADLTEGGIVLTGGGALIAGIGHRLSQNLELPVRVAERPLYSVVLGAGRYLERL